MIRVLLLLLTLFMPLFAEFKINSIKQLENGVVLNFDKVIKKDSFKHFKLKNNDGLRYVYDVEAQILGNAKVFGFQDNITIKIAQNSSQKVRIVITAQNEQNITLETAQKQATFRILNAKKQENISIAALFNEPTKNTKKNIETIKKQDSNKESKKDDSKKDSTQQAKISKNLANSKTIVLDPGHGGDDCGAMGINKTCEKKIVLNIGLYVRDILKKRGYKVYMTRSSDKFISLRNRTKIANDKNADLFISIHANSIAENRNKLEGVESYFLSTARSERAKKVAAAENKDDTQTMNYFSKQSFLNTLNTQRIVASNKLAIDIQYGMLQSLRPKYKNIVDGGVREGPFWVLVGALMPSVLLEIGYISHPIEGKRIMQTNYQKTIAQGIADGIDGYFLKNP
ncbi:MAG: N-acetylmuramoyl-L-alanine amidase [Helicobacter sp.]|nr:N-acetylmuramoyl-L-alanine amidase [Helicobacteraceae bacterium]MDY3113234.1 N-acetylmuramoyl-L-alanine amidase [Helicobacter sp.]